MIFFKLVFRVWELIFFTIECYQNDHSDDFVFILVRKSWIESSEKEAEEKEEGEESNLWLFLLILKYRF